MLKKVILSKVDEERPRVAEVRDFEQLRRLIGGFVGVKRCGDFWLFFDEDGEAKGLPSNGAPFGVALVGNYAVGKLDVEDVVGLTEVEVDTVFRRIG